MKSPGLLALAQLASNAQVESEALTPAWRQEESSTGADINPLAPSLQDATT